MRKPAARIVDLEWQAVRNLRQREEQEEAAMLFNLEASRMAAIELGKSREADKV